MSTHTPSPGPDHRSTTDGENRVVVGPSPSETAQPVLRAFLLGEFALQQGDGTPIDVSTVIGRNQSLLLLKLLLCHPQRRLTRDMLTDIIWPGQSVTAIEGSLGVSKSLLNTGLEHLCGQSLLPRVTGNPPGYQLAGQSIFWSDVEACESAIRRAIATPQAAEALTYWEAAYAWLQRGVLLADDQTAYWYHSRLIQDLRKKLAKQRTQCVLRIADLALECGNPQRALAVLSEESVANPANEDIALHLMEVFAQRGQHADVLQCYAQVEAALLERNSEPRADLRTLVQRLRSAEINRSFPEKYAVFPARTGPALPSSPPSASTGDASLTNAPSDCGAIDWGEAPRTEQFYGRAEELATLKTWILEERCRLVAILGMGGIGKTSLAAVFAEQIRASFDFVFWRSLQHAPPLRRLLQECIAFLSRQQRTDLPDELDQQILILLEYLREHRCLLVCDNVETLLQSGNDAGSYRADCEEYQAFFQRVGEAGHQSCLLLTSRENPKGLSRLEGNRSAARLLYLSGVGVAEGKALLHEKRLDGPDDAWKKLIQLYGGNPLALQLISEPIREVFSANITTFLNEGDIVVGDITDLLEHQFHRLSEREKGVLYWLAIEREAVSLDTLMDDEASSISKKALLNILVSLRRRSLIEANAGLFTLQPVIMEYVTDELVSQIAEEIEREDSHLLASHALLKAQAKEYLREAQIRFILTPLKEQLLTRMNREGIERKVKALLRMAERHTATYVAGNLLNLLIHMHYDLNGYDFSDLHIRQAFLQEARLPSVNFARANLATSVFTDTFASVFAVDLSPDGTILAAGTGSGEVRLWDAATGMSLRTCQGHMDWVRSVAFSPDGRLIASGSEDQTIGIWEVNTGQCLSMLHGHTHRVRSVAFGPQGNILASGSEDHSVRLWNVGVTECISHLQGHTDQVRAVTFHPDGNVIASGSEDQTLRLWDVHTSRCLRVVQNLSSPIFSVAFSLDGQFLVCGSENHTINLFEVLSGQHLKTFRGHSGKVRSVAFSPDGRVIVSGSEDQTLRLWDVDTGQCLKVFQGHTGAIFSLVFRFNGGPVISGSEDQTIRFWDVMTGWSVRTLRGYADQIRSLAFSPDGHMLASGSEDQTVRLWNVRTEQQIRIFSGHTNRVRAIAFHPAGRILASGSEDQTVRFWDVNTGQCLRVLHGHTNRVRSVVFSPTGNIVASGGEDHTIRLWDVESGRCLTILHGHSNRVRALSFSSDGHLLASGSEDQTVRLWTVSDGQLLKTLQDHTSWVWSIAFSSDGKYLISGNEDRAVLLWDVESGHCLRSLQGHTNRVRSVAFSPDRHIIASGSEDQTVRLWDASTGACLHVLHGHGSWVWAVVFHPDGKSVASGSHDGTIKIWDTQTGECVTTLRNQRPYEYMNITRSAGLTYTQKEILKTLGAFEEADASL